MSNKILANFIGTTEELLVSIQTIFPECEECHMAIKMFNTFVKDNSKGQIKFMKTLHKMFEEKASLLKDRDPEGIFTLTEETPLLEDLNLRQKWKELDPESVDNFWSYITKLKMFCEIYFTVPESVFGQIEKVASSVSDDVQNGNLNLSKLDLQGLTDNLMNNMSEEETKQFEENLPKLFDSLSGVLGELNQGNEDSGLDLNNMLKSIMAGKGEIDMTSLLKGAMGDTDMKQLMQTANNDSELCPDDLGKSK